MPFLLFLLISLSSLFAGVEKISLKNLDLDYESGVGQGVLDKFSIGIGMSSLVGQQEVLIFRKENSFELTVGAIALDWIRPISFVYDIKKLETKNLNLEVQKTFHELSAEQFNFTSGKDAFYGIDNFHLLCQGDSKDDNLIFKIQKDCLNKLELSVKKIEIPFDFFKTLASELPDVGAETDFPANDFYLSVMEGNIYSSLRIKLIFPASIQFWGMTQIEDQGQTLAIRVSEIRYGPLPVTDLVMKVLASQVRHDRLKIDPPWIRIKIGLKNETLP
jgi:hypothetical protein